MDIFCVKCGDKLNNKGICPKCDGDLNQKYKRSSSNKMKIKIIFCIITILTIAVVILRFAVFKPSKGSKISSFKEYDQITSVEVDYELSGWGGTVKIEDLDDNNEISTTAGSLGHPINISTKRRNVKNANIKFKYNPESITAEDAEKLAVAYYNEEIGRVELLKDSKVDIVNSTVSVQTNHFSEYVVVNSTEWYKEWAKSQPAIRNEFINNSHYNMIFVIDKSGSMSGNDKNGLSKECTYKFIEKLYIGDKFSVAAFDDSCTNILSDTYENVVSWEGIKKEINSIQSGGGTNIEEAIRYSLDSKEENDYENLMVLLSDGQAKVNDDILQTAKEQNIKIITIGLGSDADEELLKHIAVYTGGKYFKATQDNIEDIFVKIQEAYVGVGLSQDSDGDGLPDIVEKNGMRNQFGDIIYTDPLNADTDNDGISDGLEMGRFIVDENVSDDDLKNGVDRFAYFKMLSNPTVYDTKKEYSPLPGIREEYEISEDKTKVTLKITIVNKGILNWDNNTLQDIKNANINIELPECLGNKIDTNIGDIKAGEENVFTQVFNYDLAKCDCEKHKLNIKISADNINIINSELMVKGLKWYENLTEEEYLSEDIKLVNSVKGYCDEFDEKKLRKVMNDSSLTFEEKKEYIDNLKNTLSKRYAMNNLCNNDLYVASIFKETFEANFFEQGVINTSKLFLGDGILTTVVTNPDKARFKKMLISYINEYNKKQKEDNEVDIIMRDSENVISAVDGILGEIKDNSAVLNENAMKAYDNIKNAVEYLERPEKSFDRIIDNIEKMVKNVEELEESGVIVKDPFKLGVSALNDVQERAIKINNLSSKVSQVSDGVTLTMDALDAYEYYVELDAAMKSNESVDDFLALIEQKTNMKDLSEAAAELREILKSESKLKEEGALKLCANLFDSITEKGVDCALEELGSSLASGSTGAAVAEVFGSVSMGITISKLIVDIGFGFSDILDGAEYSVASAEIANILSEKVKECKTDFLTKYIISKDEAIQAAKNYKYYYEYLRTMRKFGEEKYLEMRNFKGGIEAINQWMNNKTDFEEYYKFCSGTISYLDSCSFQ